jgi:hypothetical protein
MADYTLPDVAQKRVRFFDGQYLQDQDFIDEQKYHLDRGRRMPRLLGVSGVVQGLVVTASATFQVLVGRGAAIDDDGRQLVLAADTTLTLTAKFAKQQNVEIRIVYREQATDVAQTGGKSARRFDETPLIAAVAPDGSVAVAPSDALTTWDGPSVLLATLVVGDSGIVTVDPSTQVRAGLELPGAIEVGTSGRFGGPLSVAGHLAVGTPQAENAESWGRVLDLLGSVSTKLSVRTAQIDARVLAHDAGWFGGPAGMIVGTRTNHALSLGTNGATRVTIAPGGNVGVGGAAGNAKLTVTGAGRDVVDLSVSGRIQSASDVGGVWAGKNFVGGVEPDGAKTGFWTAGSWRLTVGPTGHVGIGTGPGDVENAESWERVVDVSAQWNAKLSLRAAGIDARMHVHNTGVYGAAAGMIVGTKSNHPLSVVTNGAARLQVSAAGNVGIGAAAGTPRLTVTGGGNDSIDLLVNGRIRSGSPMGGVWVGDTAFIGGTDLTAGRIGLFNNGTWSLTVGKNGQIGIGLGNAEVENAEGWERVVDIGATYNAKLSVRAAGIDGRLMAHGGIYGAPAGLVVGTKTNHALSLVTGGAARLVVADTGNVGIGGGAGSAKVTVTGAGKDAVDLSVSGRIQSVSNVGGLWAGGNFVGGVEPDGVKLGIWTAGNWRLTVGNTGHIGIGTGIKDVENGENWERVVEIASASNVKLSLRTDTGIDGRVLAHTGGMYGSRSGMLVGTKSNHALYFYTNGTSRVSIASTGETYFNKPIYIPISGVEWGDDSGAGFDPPGVYRYYYAVRHNWNPNNPSDGGVSFRPAGVIPSDERLKTEIHEVTGAVALLERLRGVAFRWNDSGLRYLTSDVEEVLCAGPEATHEENEALWERIRRARYPALGGRTLGVVAQDVEAVLPELVETDPTGVKGVDYSALTALLVQAVKEQQTSIRELSRRLQALEPAG